MGFLVLPSNAIVRSSFGVKIRTSGVGSIPDEFTTVSCSSSSLLSTLSKIVFGAARDDSEERKMIPTVAATAPIMNDAEWVIHPGRSGGMVNSDNYPTRLDPPLSIFFPPLLAGLSSTRTNT
jgi:hypothetical protein